MAGKPVSVHAAVGTEAPQTLYHRGHPHRLHNVSRWLRVLGPGLVTGAADDDPSGITTTSQTGATLGLGQIWLVLYVLPFMITVQEMCGRIGLVTGHGIAGVVRRHYSRKLLAGGMVVIFAANTINVGADLGAMAAAAGLLIPSAPLYALVMTFAAGVLALEIFVPYRHYARVLKVLSLSLLTYVVAGLVVAGDWSKALRTTLLPTFQIGPTFWLLVVAVFGITISPYLFFWQASQQVEEDVLHHRHHDLQHGERLLQAHRLQISRLRLDTVLGMVLAAGTNWFIIFTTASALHGHGIRSIGTAADAAKALQPLAGNFASALFALGIVGTGLLAVPVLAGSAAYGVAETFGWKEGLYRPLHQARGFYGAIALATVIGLAINFLKINPIQALVWAGALNGVVAVPLLALILWVANDRKVMDTFTNGWLSNLVGGLALLVMAGATCVLFASFILR